VDDTPRWRLTRARARMAPEQSWEMRLDGERLQLEPETTLPERTRHPNA
jgi:hypothetical protein